MRFFKKSLLLILSLTFSMSLAGCYDYRETNELAIVNGMAIDKTKENKFLLTVEYAKVSSSEGTMQSTGEIESVEGNTIFDAARNAISKVGKKLYWGHAQIVIVSSSIGETGISPVIDWINRDSEMRSEMLFLISKNCEARKILNNPMHKNLIMSNVLSKVVVNQKSLSKAEYSKDLVWIYQYMAREEVGLTVPVVYLDSTSDKLSPVVSGSAIFKRDKIIGYIDGEETKTMLFIRGSLKGGLIVLQNILNTGSNASLEIFSNKTKHKVSYDSGNITITTYISPSVNIGELSDSVDFIDLRKQDELKAFADEKLENDVKALIDKVQKNNFGDIFDFSKIIKLQKPDLWRSIEKDWQKTFNNIHFVVKSDIKIKGSARTSKPIKIGG